MKSAHGTISARLNESQWRIDKTTKKRVDRSGK